MRHFSGVVLGQPSTQIVGDPDVEVLGIEAIQNVDVFHEPILLSATPFRRISLFSLEI